MPCGQPEGVLFVPVFIMAPGAKSINRAHVRPSVPWSSGTMGQGDSGQFNNGQVHNVTMSRWDIGPRDKRLRDNGPMSSETMDIGTKGTETMRRGTMLSGWLSVSLIVETWCWVGHGPARASIADLAAISRML